MRDKEIKMLALRKIWGMATWLCELSDGEEISESMQECIDDGELNLNEAKKCQKAIEYEAQLLGNKIDRIRIKP